MGKRYGQPNIASVCLGPPKKARFSFVTLNGEEWIVSVVWLAKVVLLLQLKCGQKGEGNKGAFVKYMELTAPLGAAKKNLGCIRVRFSNSGKLDHFVCGEEHKHATVMVGN